jgi:pyridoxal phosphate enzyme (YggS family)
MLPPPPTLQQAQHWQTHIAQRLETLGYPHGPQWHTATGQAVTLVAVSKAATAAQVWGAQLAGLTHFGENRLESLLAKQATLPPHVLEQLVWHWVGPLQRNKAAKVLAAGVGLIHSVDRIELADTLERLAAQAGQTQAVLLQTNVLQEANKQGAPPAEVPRLAQHMQAHCPHLQLQGLMAMAPKGAPPSVLKAVFEGAAQLKGQLKAQLKEQRCLQQTEVLSMGMSEDYSQALAHGATMVRIGRFLFA